VSWDDLVAAALIGTDRRPVAASVPEGSPAGLADVLSAREPEERLLGAAAAWTVARRAGAVAGPALAAPAPAEVDERPLAPAPRLRMMLEGTFPSLLPEWLALVAERGLRPPPELVPALLDHAGPSLHAAVAEAAGPLGRWLAARSPRWGFVLGVDEGAWADGSPVARRALLERLRRTDPPAARALLASTFADETWEDRAAFIAALAVGLSDEDEPLLETALDDRRKPVRDAAVALLARLPHSRFGARMAARTAPLLRVEDDALVVTLPGDPDAAALRDGVPTGGRRSERLRFLLAATPLHTTRIQGSDPGIQDAYRGQTPVCMPVRDDLGEVVRAGWVEAAIAQGDAVWARELWAVRPEPELLLALPREEAQGIAAAAPEPDVAARALPGPWGLELSRAAIGAIERRRKAGERGQDVTFAGHRLDPALAQEAEERLRDLGGRDLWVLCDLLAARAAMLRELS
jgi:hypothetical protein